MRYPLLIIMNILQNALSVCNRKKVIFDEFTLTIFIYITD